MNLLLGVLSAGIIRAVNAPKVMTGAIATAVSNKRACNDKNSDLLVVLNGIRTMDKRKKKNRSKLRNRTKDYNMDHRSEPPDGTNPSHLTYSLSFSVQHTLLTYLQTSLENICHEFGMRWCPDEMVRRGWVQPNSLELTSWVRLLRQKARVFPPEALDSIDITTFTKIMNEVAQIRHCAVHRQMQNNHSILQSLNASMVFAKLHRDERFLENLELLRQSCHELVCELQCQQEKLQGKLQAKIQTILSGHEPHMLNSQDHDTYKNNYFLIEKMYPTRSGLQLHRLKNTTKFVCGGCETKYESAWVAFPIDDTNRPFCNRCYGLALSKKASVPDTVVSAKPVGSDCANQASNSQSTS